MSNTQSFSTIMHQASLPKHFLEKDIINATNRKPSVKNDISQAKLVLQQRSQDTGDSLYDHLTNVLERVLDEQPKNVVDYFELYSQQIKEDNFQAKTQLNDVYVVPERLKYAQKVLPLLKDAPVSISTTDVSAEIVENEETEQQTKHKPNLLYVQFYWNMLGIGFPTDEVYLLVRSIQRLQKSTESIKHCSFWGKIYGLRSDYFIVEAAMSDDAIEERQRSTLEYELTEYEETIEEESSEELGREEIEEEKERPLLPEIPKSKYNKLKPVPTEPFGTGLNQNLYYVCNNIEDEWTELPLVTPDQIVVSRKIRKYLTGCLDAEIVSYPDFPGTEKNYLRTLIARITSETHVSPMGYFKIDSQEEEEEEIDEEDSAMLKGNDKNVILDEDYIPFPANVLLDLNVWVHHTPRILKQGRVSCYDAKKSNKKQIHETEDEEEEKIEEESEISDQSPEVGSSLFTSCAEDESVGNISPWKTKLEGTDCQAPPIVVAQSNIWPGAWAFAIDKMSEVIYIGWGLKQTTNNYCPPFLLKLQAEYVEDAADGLIETDDPTLEQEKACWQKMLIAEKFEDDDELEMEEFEVDSMDEKGSIENVLE